jgi:hypothetical protein
MKPPWFAGPTISDLKKCVPSPDFGARIEMERNSGYILFLFIGFEMDIVLTGISHD